MLEQKGRRVYMTNAFVTRTSSLCFRGRHKDSEHERADDRGPAYKVLGGRQEAHLHW